jgi:hypothetical protein
LGQENTGLVYLVLNGILPPHRQVAAISPCNPKNPQSQNPLGAEMTKKNCLEIEMKKKKPIIEKIIIDVIDHIGQRYDTVGDWFFMNDRELHIKASRIPNDPDNEKSLAIAIHELVEALLCRAHGVSQKEVDNFDLKWTPHKDSLNELGDDPDSPYHLEHGYATSVERLIIAAMGLNWTEYERSISFIR